MSLEILMSEADSLLCSSGNRLIALKGDSLSALDV